MGLPAYKPLLCMGGGCMGPAWLIPAFGILGTNACGSEGVLSRNADRMTREFLYGPLPWLPDPIVPGPLFPPLPVPPLEDVIPDADPRSTTSFFALRLELLLLLGVEPRLLLSLRLLLLLDARLPLLLLRLLLLSLPLRLLLFRDRLL